ncbi:hypothetical protein [Armatimonas rosea]|uniref:DUF3108 domain-containing protein n=1 Tax=Armatimonas rosea TaxID=685828 RepID=A0A7W9W5F0_ARMRO|nr:hypothetical protein [Armatimonas rosea]MBB6050374.1 hypothetical protein [Armatimonas rosea]
MKRPIAFALLALVAAAAPRLSHAQTAAPAAQASAPGWTFVYKKGEELRFRTYIRITGRTPDDAGAVNLTVKSTSKNTTKDVLPTGVVVWEQLDEAGGAAALNGMALPVEEEPKPVTITFNPTGLISKRLNPAADPADQSQRILPILSSFPVPPAGVKPGDSWKTELPNPMLKNRQFTATSTFIGNEKVLGIDCLKVELTMTFPTMFGQTEKEYLQHTETYWLDASTRQLVRGSYVTKNPVMPFPVKSAVAKTLVSRIVAGQNEKEDPEGVALLSAK